MGLFSWLSGRGRRSDKEIVRLPGPGDYEIEVVGESNYQKALVKIAGGKTEEGVEIEVDALLIHDDANPYDNKAIAVSIEGETVGYLAKKMARSFRAQLEEAGYAGHPAVCSALIVGGWDRGNGDAGNFGVRLDLPHKG